MTRISMAAAMSSRCSFPRSQSHRATRSSTPRKRNSRQSRTNVIRTAEKVPEDLYAFKPTPEVRSLGQLIAHIADGNFGICGAGSTMKPPMSGIEKSTGGNGKAALQKALAASFEFCESAWASMDNTKSGETVKTFLGVQPRSSVLFVQHLARLGALRQPRDLHALEGHRPALIRADEVGQRGPAIASQPFFEGPKLLFRSFVFANEHQNIVQMVRLAYSKSFGIHL